MKTSFFSVVSLAMACGIFVSTALGQATAPPAKKPGTPPQVGKPIKLERTPPKGEEALKRLPSRRRPQGAQNLSPNQLKSRREQIQQRRLITIGSRITELESKRSKGQITKKEKALLKSLRQYITNYQNRRRRESKTDLLTKPSQAKAQAKTTILNLSKPPSPPAPLTPPSPNFKVVPNKK
jgi:hypothetical protein